jgi:hypothetical protein
MLRIVDEVAKASGISRQKWIREAVETALKNEIFC